MSGDVHAGFCESGRGRFPPATHLVAHCDTEVQAHTLLTAIADRLGAVGLELHPDKTKIVFCKDANRRGRAEHTSFDFLGYTFRGRLARGPRGYFVSFSPAMSAKAKKAVGQKVRGLAPQPSQRHGPVGPRWGHQSPGTGLDQLLRGLCAVNAEAVAEAMLSKRWRKEPCAPWPSGINSTREGVPNHCKGRRLRAGVLSVAANGGGTSVRCAPRRRAKANLPMTRRKVVDGIRTRVEALPWDEPGRLSRSWPGGVRRKGGVSVVRALGWNTGTSRAVASLATEGTGVRRGRKPKARVPDAVHWGGPRRSSDEGAVMALERRPRTSEGCLGQPGDGEEPLCTPSGVVSRMTGDRHVRFDGSGRGQFPPATLLYRSELNSLARRIDEHLVRWAMQKFKRLRRLPARAWVWLNAVRQRQPALFAHWRLALFTRGRPVGAV